MNIIKLCHSFILKVWQALFIVAVRSFLPSDEWQWGLGEGGGGGVARSVGVEMLVVVGWTLTGQTSRAATRLLAIIISRDICREVIVTRQS